MISFNTMNHPIINNSSPHSGRESPKRAPGVIHIKRLLFTLASSAWLSCPAHAETFYLNSLNGKDSNTGQASDQAWKSLSKANTNQLKPGDSLVLNRGGRFEGGLALTLEGTAEKPITIATYGEGHAPIIDAKGFIAGVYLKNSHHVIVKDLEITADGGETRDGSKPGFRYGVYVQSNQGSTSHVTIENLTIYKIYPEIPTKSEGKNPTTYLGSAIAIEGEEEKPSSAFVVRGCRIAETGYKAVSLSRIQDVQVLDNQMKDIGGPAIQPGRVEDLIVRGNVVDRSGSGLDPRMHARGSGIWPWTCKRVLIEKNKFMHARGKGDSCGIHIDYNCSDVVVQYNLSVDNEGGFAEILGKNHNCAYRYNISINDGSRVKNQNGAQQEGKILMTSGFVGGGKSKEGPYNSYIYNNTIFVKENSRSCFSIAPSTQGLLVANNIFHILGTTVNVLDDQDKRKDKLTAKIPRSFARNNIYSSASVLPKNIPFKDTNMIVGDVGFSKPGGTEASDYIPQNTKLIKDQGIEIPILRDDANGLKIGLKATKDFFGNPIIGNPDIGAIEIN